MGYFFGGGGVIGAQNWCLPTVFYFNQARYMATGFACYHD